MFKVQGINHITIRVSNLDESIKFYVNVLGAKIVHKGNTDIYLDVGGVWLCLIEIKDAKPMDKNQVGVDHFAFTVSEEHFPKAVLMLHEQKVSFTRGPIQRGGGNTVSFTDPDGNEIEFFTGSLQKRMKNWN
ncbi:metallothiol transferase [Fictibacillus halophilus]|uniref:Metallothiol transferase n=1 Tax=Fictibacillus halophilus TaxID=1610490 RepID=A0ABV2LMS1_9BACL|nr:VOC family protein [Fictibacillus halophilus]